jgi:hypothetical protein
MKNERWILCFDFETDLPDKDKCNPVQLAAVPINPETLEVKKDEAFQTFIKPPGINKEEYFDVPKRMGTIQWHANNYGCSVEEVIDRWKSGVSEKIAWNNFCNYCKKYTVDKKPGQWYPEPIPAGYNIIGFDIPIVERLCKKHKTKFPFSGVNKLDAMDMLFWWFESLEEPNDFKMDTWRTFFGIKQKGGIAHDALTDVYEESAIITRFMKFHRKQSSVGKFKNSFAGVEV